jgi:hypothetical protein
MTLENIIKESKELLTEQFEKGVGLRGTPLKRFSGPTLENWSENTIKSIIKDLREKYPDADIEWSKDYLPSDFEGLGDERLDQHVKVNGKYAYLQEDRAWVDKPFYTLKRAVVRNIMQSCESLLSPNVKFGLIGYSLDFKEDLVNTCNKTQGYGDRFERFSLTGRRRGMKVNGKKVNWYETGFVEETVVNYIKYVYTTLEEAILA